MKFEDHQQNWKWFEPDKVLTYMINVAQNHVSNNCNQIPDIERAVLFGWVLDEHQPFYKVVK